MRLEAVMENLQRQQAARLRQAEKELQSQLQHQALLRHYQAAVRLSPGLAPGLTPGLGLGLRTDRASSEERDQEESDEEPLEQEEQGHDQEQEHFPLNTVNHGSLSSRLPPGLLPGLIPGRTVRSESPHNPNHEWTYEEQFKQLYELDSDEKRKEFLDDLFGFMQKRGTPVNRIPIMAKQVLDLYMLYKLVTEKGGLVEVINKKIWREITKGLNLPTSITSAAFTLRTQYMKYLYPYECEKRGLSSPSELQAAIDMHLPHLPHLHTSGALSGALSQLPSIKKEEPLLSSCLPGPGAHHSHHMGAVQVAALETLREKMENSEPPQKKMMMEEHRLVQQALQRNLLAMATQLPLSISLSNRDDRQEAALNLSTDGISSINMSIEINGVVYTGLLFARSSALGTGAHHPGPKHSSAPHILGKSSPILSTAHFSHQPPSSASSSSSYSTMPGNTGSSPRLLLLHPQETHSSP
ncbi:hypothetical protein WMY93_019448 [Mugilogobius chulae]|uniref:AT-rich interactive domain-containing protein 3 n=1 Tax=Mugilogobius chulae TaxID=88201 RepID=A0AAW0NJ72_9GOBI